MSFRESFSIVSKCPFHKSYSHITPLSKKALSIVCNSADVLLDGGGGERASPAGPGQSQKE